MKLLYICGYQFIKIDGVNYTTPSSGNEFWSQYTDVFEEIDVLGEPYRTSPNMMKTVPITRNDVNIKIIPSNTRPNELKNDFKVKKELKTAIKDAEAILIKVGTRKAIMAIKYAKKYNKPYMIGVTGDLNRQLTMSNNRLRRLYAPIIYKNTLKAIKDCKFGTYVTQEYLQKTYPIQGKMCGFTDTVVPYVSDGVLDKRLNRINSLKDDSSIIVGLIGYYKTNAKGLDTIIESMEYLHNSQIKLHILGVGTKEDQLKWIEFGKEHGVKNIYFDEPVSGVENVFEWIDQIDICVLPSRSEGLPRSIVEAISRGCPCIVSNVCGMPELVDDKWLHEPEDFKKLAELLDLMIRDKSNMIEAAQRNHAHSKSYSSENIKRKRNDFFNEFKNYAMNTGADV
jgi:glycosyltransferase involved in cell wall biosynthesis